MKLQANEQIYEVSSEPDTPLLWVIRDELGLTGTKYGCGLTQCGGCHTPRGAITFAEKGIDETSASFLPGTLFDGWYAPRLRQDHNTCLGRWSEDDIFQILKNGGNQYAVVFSLITEAYNNSLQFLTDEDLRAMSHCLKSLPGDPSRRENHGGLVSVEEVRTLRERTDPASIVPIVLQMR